MMYGIMVLSLLARLRLTSLLQLSIVSLLLALCSPNLACYSYPTSSSSPSLICRSSVRAHSQPIFRQAEGLEHTLDTFCSDLGQINGRRRNLPYLNTCIPSKETRSSLQPPFCHRDLQSFIRQPLNTL